MPPLNSLNLIREYCEHWTVSDALREIIQNLIDGAVDWIQIYSQDKQKSDVRRAGKGWYISKCSPPKKFMDAGYVHGGRAVTVLTVSEHHTSWTMPSKMSDWLRDRQSLAYIKIEYASSSGEEIDWTDFLEKGLQPPNTCITKFEAVNRLVRTSFDMEKMLHMGASSKRGDDQQVGKFGDGFKVAALEVVRKGYDFKVEADDEHWSFIIKEGLLCYEHRDSKLSTFAWENPGLFIAKLEMKKPRIRAFDDDRYRFNPSLFRLLSPGVAYSDSGEVLSGKPDKGALYCMGIFVYKHDSLLRGYDIPSKDFIDSRDRKGTCIKRRALCRLMLPLIRNASENDEDFIPALLHDILTLSDKDARRCYEVDCLFSCELLGQKFALCFREEKGDDAFPCMESEKKEFDKSFKNRQPVVLPSTLVELLRKCGYRNIEEEIDYLFSDNNKVDVDEEGEALVKSCLYRLNKVDASFRLSRDDLVFINGQLLANHNRLSKGTTT